MPPSSIEPILASGSWPIFVQWDASLMSCYSDHLFYIRQGEDWGAWGIPLAPLYLLADLLRGLADVPKVAMSQGRSFVLGWPGLLVGEQAAAGRALDRLGLPDPSGLFEQAGDTADYDPFAPGATEDGPEAGSTVIPIDISVGEDYQTNGELVLDLCARLITYPIKLVEEPFLAGIGPPAWNQMQRRVYLLFNSERELRSGRATPSVQGFPYFLSRLRELQGAEGLEITLVSHSMGAIVANEILRAEPELEIDTLVYMAGACSLRDYEAAVWPYLEAHPETHLYNLTLHPKAEVRERQILDLTSRGSLLVWIDGFLAQPLTPLDRVAGNFSNLILAVHRTPDELRPRIHVKAFPTGRSAPEGTPTKHAHFTKVPFWEESFWLSD